MKNEMKKVKQNWMHASGMGEIEQIDLLINNCAAPRCKITISI
jgi:hypothetical protein